MRKRLSIGSVLIQQSFINSGDYDDEDDYPDLAERVEAYKSKYFLKYKDQASA